MYWQYSRSHTKILLVATLCLFAGYALILAHNWATVNRTSVQLSAQTIGVLATVPPNEQNTLAQELKDWEDDLTSRETALAGVNGGSGADTRTLFFVSIVGSGLLGLILMNFYLDSQHRRSLA